MKHREWSTLKPGEQNRVRWAQLAFRQYFAGYHASVDASTIGTRTPLVQFLESGLYHYVVSFLKDGRGLRPLFKVLHCSELLDPVDNLLARPFGRKTLGWIVFHIRDKQFAHPSYEVKDWIGPLVNEAGIVGQEQLTAVAESADLLIRTVGQVGVSFLDLYPEPVDNQA